MKRKTKHQRALVWVGRERNKPHTPSARAYHAWLAGYAAAMREPTSARRRGRIAIATLAHVNDVNVQLKAEITKLRLQLRYGTENAGQSK